MPICTCGRLLDDKDRMGVAAYSCPLCRKMYRPEVAARPEDVVPDHLREWHFAKRLLIGVCIASFVVICSAGAIMMSLLHGGGEPIFTGVTIGCGVAIAAATLHAETARRRARRAEGKNPNKLF